MSEYQPEPIGEVESIEVTEDMLKYGSAASTVERMRSASEDYSEYPIYPFTLDHSLIFFGLAAIMLHIEMHIAFPVMFGICGAIQFFHSQRNSFVMRKIRRE